MKRGVAIALAIGSLGLGATIVVFAATGSAPFPLPWEDADRASTWLILLVLNYLLAAMSLSTIMVSTDGAWGVAWAAISSFLGAAMFCVYLGIRVTREQTLALRPYLPHSGDKANFVTISQVLLGVAFVAFVILFGWTQVAYPIVPPKLDDGEWGTIWSITTVGDYATCSLCLSLVVIWTEEAARAVMWSVVIMLTGGVGCAAYVSQRLLADGAALSPNPDSKDQASTELTEPGQGG